MRNIKILALCLIVSFEALVLLMPPGISAQPWDGGADVVNCPPICNAPRKIWISIACQQKKLIDGPRAAGCCFYCAEQPNSSSDTSSRDIRSLPVDVFDTSLDLTTAAGIATLIVTGLQLFLGAAALYVIYVAVTSALSIANPETKDALILAQKKLVSALVGLFICGAGLLFLQLLTTWLGLRSIDQVFRTIAPVLQQGSGG
jgi:hypothetical protein